MAAERPTSAGVTTLLTMETKEMIGTEGRTTSVNIISRSEVMTRTKDEVVITIMIVEEEEPAAIAEDEVVVVEGEVAVAGDGSCATQYEDHNKS